jgi:predicted aspartyl protease
MRIVTGPIVNGSAIIKVRLAGNSSQQPIEFQAVFDTGFSGFVYIPLIQALPLGLTATGTTPVTLADGKTYNRAWAEIWAVVDGQKERDIAILEPTASADILIGMDFLRVFKIGLFLTSANFALVDEVVFAQFLSSQQPSSGPASAASSPTP